MTSWGQSHDRSHEIRFTAEITRGVLVDLMIPVATVGWLLMAIGICYRFGIWAAVGFMLLAIPAACFTLYLLDRAKKAPPTEADGARARAGARVE